MNSGFFADYPATDVESNTGSFLLAEAWLHGTYPRVIYKRIDRTSFNQSFGEKANKTYSIVAEFPARIVITPVEEIEEDYGVNWEDGEILVMTPRFFLQQQAISVTRTDFQTLDDNLTTDDRLTIPTVRNSKGQSFDYSIKRVLRNGYYGELPLMVNFICMPLPGQNQ